MAYDWDFSFLWTYRSVFLDGVVYTISFTVATSVCGLLLGAAIATAGLTAAKYVKIGASLLVEIFRCTPVLVQLLWCYYALPLLTGIALSPAFAAFLTLSFYGAAFYAEIIRGGIGSIDAGQWDAGSALGMSRQAILRRIILPQAIRRMVAPLTSQCVLQLKNTSLLSVLAVPDLLYQAQLVTTETYRPIEVYTLVAVVYFIVLFPMTRFAVALERRMAL